MKRITTLLAGFLFLAFGVMAQRQEENIKKGFRKENFFTGGSISLAFYNNTFLIGGSPMFGYSVTNWLDAGVVVNYNYTSYRDYLVFDDRLRQTNFGGGGFVKLYPVRFVFAQAQYEYNNVNLKYILPNNGNTTKTDASAGSFLVGGGLSTSRMPGSGRPFMYFSVMFDVAEDENSPYTDAYGRAIPVIRTGVQIPLFQGKKGNQQRSNL